MVNFRAIEVGTSANIWKAMTIDGEFYLKRCLEALII